MPALSVAVNLQQFIDEELLRAPLLFDQLTEAALDRIRKSLPTLSPMHRSAAGDLIQALGAQRRRLSEYFVRSLGQHAREEVARHAPKSGLETPKAMTLALVDEDVVALDVELSHTIEAIKSAAEHELLELQTYTSALVGDMDVSRDHNPFRAEAYARALGAAAQALPLSRGQQVAFMRHAGPPLAQLLRRTYAAASSRLESQGIEPAAYRTVILPSGSRRSARFRETTFSPDLHRMRDSMPAPLQFEPAQVPTAPISPMAPAPSSRTPRAPGARPRPAPALPVQHWSKVAEAAANRADRQAVELVSRLFESMLADERVPADAAAVIARLHSPALHMTLRDSTLLDQDRHPLWRLINRLVFEAQMTPDPADPDRIQLLRLAQGAADQIASEPEQNAGLYRWALERLEGHLNKRFSRRLAAAASHIGALQKLEDKLVAGQTTPSTLHGMLDVPQLDTVPAELMATAAARESSPLDQEWLDALRPGDWVRMFLQGHWVHAALLWPGERREAWLFGDGASDSTWAIRRGALLMMHGAQLVKKLKQRSIVGSAAARVQEQLAAAAAG